MSDTSDGGMSDNSGCGLDISGKGDFKIAGDDIWPAFRKDISGFTFGSAFVGFWIESTEPLATSLKDGSGFAGGSPHPEGKCQRKSSSRSVTSASIRNRWGPPL